MSNYVDGCNDSTYSKMKMNRKDQHYTDQNVKLNHVWPDISESSASAIAAVTTSFCRSINVYYIVKWDNFEHKSGY